MTATEESALAGYFTMDPLLGSGDPFSAAWDADLKPDEYGDQSAHWDDDHASFTDSDDEDDDDDCVSEGSCDEGEWSIVYAASFTVVTSANAGVTRRGSNVPPPAPPQPQPLQRRDSKVRFCEQPPKVVSYECCSRENYSQLYYSVHELQKIIDEVRLEKKTDTVLPHHTHNNSGTRNTNQPSRSA